MDKQLVVTSFEQLAEYSKGVVVELPPFGPDQPFVARLCRPSLLTLAKVGKIPNTLLTAANRLFFGDDKGKRDQDALSKTLDVIDVICDAAFVEPTYKQIKDSGVQLSDDQYMFVFNFTQSGVRALSSFRAEQGDTKDTATIESV